MSINPLYARDDLQITSIQGDTILFLNLRASVYKNVDLLLLLLMLLLLMFCHYTA